MKEFEIAEGWLKRVIAVRLHPGEDVLLRLEQLAEELQARSDEMQAQLLRTPRIVGPRRMLRAFPGLKHGVKKTTLKALRLGLARRESPEEEPKKNGSDTRKDA